jgi:hypothetical protein
MPASQNTKTEELGAISIHHLSPTSHLSICQILRGYDIKQIAPLFQLHTQKGIRHRCICGAMCNQYLSSGAIVSGVKPTSKLSLLLSIVGLLAHGETEVGWRGC